MPWRYSEAGREMCRPNSEDGIHIDGPLTVEDWKNILEEIIAEMVEQARREGR